MAASEAQLCTLDLGYAQQVSVHWCSSVQHVKLLHAGMRLQPWWGVACTRPVRTAPRTGPCWPRCTAWPWTSTACGCHYYPLCCHQLVRDLQALP